jgi:hypothetical protein
MKEKSGEVAEMRDGFPTLIFVDGVMGQAFSCRKSSHFVGPIPPLKVGDPIRFSLAGSANFALTSEILSVVRLEKSPNR